MDGCADGGWHTLCNGVDVRPTYLSIDFVWTEGCVDCIVMAHHFQWTCGADLRPTYLFIDFGQGLPLH